MIRSQVHLGIFTLMGLGADISGRTRCLFQSQIVSFGIGWWVLDTVRTSSPGGGNPRLDLKGFDQTQKLFLTLQASYFALQCLRKVMNHQVSH
jgi:hypothetical protein